MNDFTNGILIAILVNLAASALFFSIQPLLEKYKPKHPYLVHSLGIVLFFLAICVLFGFKALLPAEINIEQKVISIPLLKIIGQENIICGSENEFRKRNFYDDISNDTND